MNLTVLHIFIVAETPSIGFLQVQYSEIVDNEIKRFISATRILFQRLTCTNYYNKYTFISYGKNAPFPYAQVITHLIKPIQN